MSDGKRYYWLKLHDDFFDSKRIKKLRKMAGGDTYTIIYLKMQLLAIKTEGVLKWTGLEDNFADELALDIDESPDDVRITLSFLMSCGLAETSDDVSFFLPYTVYNTGSETASTQRSRECRARKSLLQCNTSATLPQHTCSAEKEIEIELDTRDREKSKSKRKEYSSVPELNDAIVSFIEFRKTIKKPMPDRAIDLLISKLNKLSSDTETQIEIINQSILNGWAGVFELKGGKTNGKHTTDSPEDRWGSIGIHL